MSKIHLTLTEDQASAIYRCLGYGLYEDPLDTEEKRHNAFLKRIQRKIVTQLAKAHLPTKPAKDYRRNDNYED